MIRLATQLPRPQPPEVTKGRGEIEFGKRKFTLGPALGATEMSIAHIARDNANRLAVVKITTCDEREDTVRSEVTRQFAARELRIASTLGNTGHPGMIRYLTGGRTIDGNTVIVTEYMQAFNLTRLFYEHADMQAIAHEAKDIMGRLCAIVEWLHSKGVLHLDIKPANTLLVQDSDLSVQIKLLDFGVSWYLDEASRYKQEVGCAGKSFCTPQFVPPEMIVRSGIFGEIGPWTDVYMLGGYMYWLLSQGTAHPYSGTTAYELLTAHLERPVPNAAISLGRFRVSNQAAEIIAIALQKDPMHRFQTVDEMRQTIENAKLFVQTTR